MLSKLKGYLSAHKTIDVALLVFITLLATSRWFNLEVPRGHDALADTLLAQAASHNISLHNLVPGWNTEWFLGYPSFIVHPPMISQLVWALSYPFGWILGTKLLYLSFYILSGVFAYCYAHRLTSSRCASFAAGLAYVFLPYHVLEMGFEGHHGAFGLPYMLTPLVLLWLEKLIHEPTAKHVLINGVLLAIMVLTYPQVLPFLVGPFLVLYVIVRIWWQRHRGAAYLKITSVASLAAFCLPLLLTAFWWLPLLSEIRYNAATSFPSDAAREFSATFLQAITLRPDFCCAPASAYGASGRALTEMLRFLPFLLVVLGAILNYRNRYVWFFSASILIAILLAMGPDSPIKLFNLAHRWIPFFSGLRTPWRFLLFTSLAYAVLIGFGVKSVSEWLRQLNLRRPSSSSVIACAMVLVSLIVAGNTWQENRTAFSTFTLTDDQRNAFAWLKAQDSGNYRITDLPLKTWTYDTDANWVINPVYWTYLHGKDNAYGGVPASAVAYAGDTLEYLQYNLENGADLNEWLDLFNVRYVLLDKTDPTTPSINLGKDFERIWPSATIDIYENQTLKPRVFCVSAADERDIALWTAGNIDVFLADGSKDVGLSLVDVPTRSSKLTLESIFRFMEPDPSWSVLGVDVSDMNLDWDDAVHLAFYSEDALPHVYVSLDVLEADGSRYGMDLNRVDGIKAGWNEIDFPVDLLLLRYSTDENDTLDTDQINTLCFGVGVQSSTRKPCEFSLYFDKLSVVSEKISAGVEYVRTSGGGYQAQVNSDSPFRLILSESYHPNWVAYANDSTIKSDMCYESLNGFALPAGDYEVTLAFTTSPSRKAGTIIGAISILSLLLATAFILGTNARRKRLTH